MPSRPRRNRRSQTVRQAFSETHLSPANLILPVFVHDGEKNSPIASMPGVNRLGWRHGLIDSVREARSYGVNQVVIFPKVQPLHLEAGSDFRLAPLTCECHCGRQYILQHAQHVLMLGSLSRLGACYSTSIPSVLHDRLSFEALGCSCPRQCLFVDQDAIRSGCLVPAQHLVCRMKAGL